jgi:hypothetical protein
MGKTIEVWLSDAQSAALSAEAEASGMKFFEFCRAKLVADVTAKPVSLRIPPQLTGGRSTTIQVAEADAPAKVAEFAERLAALPEPQRPPEDDRISRIEDAVARLTEFVLQGQQPALAEAQPQQPLDVDSIVNAQFAEAEAAGLTEHVPDEAEQQLAESGVRPLSRRPIPFSANSAPRHLQQLLG